MAAQHDPDRSFIHGLSDFWTSYFSDTRFTEATFEGAQVLFGQVYLDLLQEVLGTSLDHAPLFSKKYYRLFVVSEDRLRFVEGASSEDDRYFYEPAEFIAAATTLMNRVIAPTAYLYDRADYEVRAGGLLFRTNPFDVNGSTQPGFAVRTTQVTTPVVQRSPLSYDWGVAGVRVGDVLQYVVQSAPAIETEVRLVRGPRLVLADDKPEFREDLRGRSSVFRVLREPYDGVKTGVVVPGMPTSYLNLAGAAPEAGSKKVVTALAASAWVGSYLFMDDAAQPGNSGLYRVNSVDVGISATLARPLNFIATAGPVAVTLVEFEPETTGDAPSVDLPHTFITRGTLSVSGRRALSREVDGVLYPAAGALVEGVDFTINYDEGRLTFLTVWEPLAITRLAYNWRLFVAEERYVLRDDFPGGAWVNTEPYVYGNVVQQNGTYWACNVTTSTVGTFSLTEWVPYLPFVYDDAADVRQLAFWAPDVLIDEQRLYLNFGYLLGFRRPSSEQYRTFLKGVAQLFLLGPSLARMRSALNVVAGLPVVREDGEIFQQVVSAYETLAATGLSPLTGDEKVGDGGAVLDVNEGDDGVIDATAGTFYAPSARAIPNADVGAVIRVRYDSQVYDYAVTAWSADGLTATLSPAPSADLSPVRWSYRHNAANGQFRVESDVVDFLFSEQDVDSVIVIDAIQGTNWIASSPYAVGAIVYYNETSYECTTANSDASFTPIKWRRLTALPARNVGSFRVVGVDGPRAVRLEAPYGLTDARGLRWRLTRSQEHIIETDRRQYPVPIGVPIREDLLAEGAFGTELRAFEVLTDVISVVDYIVDPTWWHRVAIPQELLELDLDAPGRRQVSPQLIPNFIDAIDQAVIGDPGLYIDADDENNPGYEREGSAVWIGGGWIELTFPVGVLRATVSDVGQSLTFEAGPFIGSYAITALGPGDSVKLDRFPPPEAAGLTPHLVIERVRLPSLVYRRTVAFVMMDRFLKYHAIHAEVRTVAGLPLGFLTDAAGLLNAGKPGYTYVFVESSTGFEDRIRITESFVPDIGHPWLDLIRDVDTHLVADGSVYFNEYYRFSTGSHTDVSPGGAVSFTITPSFPYVPDRFLFVFGRFTQGNAGGYPLALGRDYTFNMATGAVVVPTMDAGPFSFDYIVVALRVHDPVPTPWWNGVHAGETPVVIGGSNPTLARRSSMGVTDEGVIERAISITIAVP